MQNSKDRFSNRVEDYVRYRPGYPDGIIDLLQTDYDLTKDKQIADIGAGTGISSELFLQAGYHVVAVEPNREMREKSVVLLGELHDFRAVDGSAEQTTLEENSVDAVICGQAFHWFDPVLARAEFVRILQSGGIVALIWNERKTEGDFEKEYDDLIIRHARDYVKVNHRNIDVDHIAAFFSPASFRLDVFANSQTFDYSGLEGRLLSSSYMPAKDDAGYPAMKTDLQALFDRHQSDGQVTILYDTKVYTGQLK